ncbi:MAG: class I SAM-dependent methyltransferase, partial [Saprospiraceae bacterium]
NDVSWYQPTPQISLDFITKSNLPLTARIIDIGGGDSFLVDHLLDLGYQNVTVLDISESAINKVKRRLGDRAQKVTLIVTDVTKFNPTCTYDFWHDRAAFHFLTEEEDISKYIETAFYCIELSGTVVLGTFSNNGPKKCSGIDIKQYSESSLCHRLESYFDKINCVTVDHKTPKDTLQNFTFCSFKRAKKIDVTLI